jgi:hypothetical protein
MLLSLLVRVLMAGLAVERRLYGKIQGSFEKPIRQVVGLFRKTILVLFLVILYVAPLPKNVADRLADFIIENLEGGTKFPD